MEDEPRNSTRRKGGTNNIYLNAYDNISQNQSSVDFDTNISPQDSSTFNQSRHVNKTGIYTSIPAQVEEVERQMLHDRTDIPSDRPYLESIDLSKPNNTHRDRNEDKQQDINDMGDGNDERDSDRDDINDDTILTSIPLDPEVAEGKLETKEEFDAISQGCFCTTEAFSAELRSSLAMSIPLTLSFLAQNAVTIVNLIFLGHLSDDDLAAAALAMLFCNITGISLINGMFSSFDTLGSQAFGAKNYRRVGIILQRSILITAVELIPISIFWMFSNHVLGLAVDKHIADMSGRYIRFSIIGLPFHILTEAFRRYLEVQENTVPVMCATVFSVATSPFLNYFYINILDMHYMGAAMTSITANIISLSCIITYLRISKFYKKTWFGFSKEALKDWWEYVRLGLPGTGMLCAEWWGFEVHTLIAGQQGTIALGSQSLITNLNAFLFMIPLGLAITASTRVGLLLGQGKPYSSQHAAKVNLLIALICQTGIAMLLFFGNKTFAQIFTDDIHIRRVVSEVLPALSFFCIFDGFQGAAAGVLRGAGRQMVGFILNVIAYWFFALPVAYYMALHYSSHWRPPEKHEPQDKDVLVKGLGIKGQWQVLNVASIFVCCVLIYVFFKMNWVKTSRIVVDRENRNKLLLEKMEEEARENGEGSEDGEDGDRVMGSKIDDYDSTYDAKENGLKMTHVKIVDQEEMEHEISNDLEEIELGNIRRYDHDDKRHFIK